MADLAMQTEKAGVETAGAATFGRGFRDALPICFGYFAVGFTVAVAAVVHGHPVWSPVLMSLTHVSGTSQGAIAGRVDFTAGALPFVYDIADIYHPITTLPAAFETLGMKPDATEEDVVTRLKFYIEREKILARMPVDLERLVSRP